MSEIPDIDKILVDDVDENQPLGRFLILLFRAFEEDLVKRLEAHGYSDVSQADLNTLRFVKSSGSTSIEIAKLAGVSKQAIAKSISAIEAKGYLKRQPNSHDGRSQIVLFTSKGRRMIGVCIHVIADIEKIYEKKIGTKAFRDLRSSLTKLLEIYA